MSDESIRPPTTSDNSLSPALIGISTKIRVKLGGSCFEQDKFTFTHKSVVNIYIVLEINLMPFKESSDFTLGHSLFGAVKLTKNVDFGNYNYFGYGIGFDVNETFSLSNGSRTGQNVIIFVVEMSSSVHIDNKKKYILILGKGPM